ncbi:MAG: tyrosine-type recombinase/integrase [Planctomycetota bacterium]
MFESNRLPARPISYVPQVISSLGKKAQKRFVTFFTDKYRNKNTRAAYHRNACQFFEWCQVRELVFPDIESYHVSAYVEEMLEAGKAKRSVKQHLATIRKLFDWLIVGQICSYNPAQAVEGPKVSAKKGVTPYLGEDSASEFLKSIDVSTVIGLRDRALIALMTFSFARISAAVAMNIDDYYQVGKKWKINLHEKGGKQHDMPAHHKLEEYLDTYIEAAGGFEAFPEEPKQGKKKPKRPLFRTTRGRSGELTNRRMSRHDAWYMIKRRAAAAGLRLAISNHSFRATGITNYMDKGGDLKKARDMANHASTKTTAIYDHSGDDITLDEVERITIGS